MRLCTLLLGFVFIYNDECIAQPEVFFNSIPIDSLRYKGIKGSPYLYEVWKTANISCRNGTHYEHVLLNFNGYEQKFEVIQQTNKVSLDDNLYDRITVYLQESDSSVQEWFLRGMHYDIAMQLANVIYNGNQIKLIRDFRVRISETTYEIQGDANVRKKFVPHRYYSILYKSKLHPLTLTKKRLGKVLENKDLVNTIIQRLNIDLSDEKDVIKLLFNIEAQLFPY